MIRGINHIAIAVKDLRGALATYKGALGLAAVHTEEIPEQAVRVAFLPVGDVEIELMEPMMPDSSVARFLERRGEGIHHICLEVDDIEAAMAELRAKGVPLVNEAPQRGAHGRIAFVHPKGTHGVLIELLERTSPKRGSFG